MKKITLFIPSNTGVIINIFVVGEESPSAKGMGKVVELYRGNEFVNAKIAFENGELEYAGVPFVCSIRKDK